MTKTSHNGPVEADKKAGREENASTARRVRIIEKAEEIAKRKAIDSINPVILEIRSLLKKLDLPNAPSTEGIIKMIEEKAIDRFVYNHTAKLLEELSDHMTKGDL